MLQRLKVIGPGALLGVCMSMCCGGPLVMNPAVWRQPNAPHPTAALLLLFGPSAGPFAALLTADNESWSVVLGLGIVLLGLIALHPLRPSTGTGVASGVGIALWYLMGFSYIYSGV